MPDQPAFADKLAAHLEYRQHLPRRFKAGKAADRLFVARVTADHDAAVGEVAETHLAAAHADGKIIEGLRGRIKAADAECTRLRHSLGKAKLDLAAAEGRIERLEAELAETRDDLAARGRLLAETRAELDQAKHDLADLEGRIATQVFVDGEAVGRAPIPTHIHAADKDLNDLGCEPGCPGYVGRDAAPEPSPATPAKAQSAPGSRARKAVSAQEAGDGTSGGSKTSKPSAARTAPRGDG